MSVEDVDALPWWQWRLYLEGLDEEARANSGEKPVRTRRSIPIGAARRKAALPVGSVLKTPDGRPLGQVI